MYDRFIGIDPGTSGAIAILDDKLNLEFCDVLPKTKNRRGANILDVDRFLKFFHMVRFDSVICGLEDVWAQPVQGAKAASSFMYAFGCIRTILKVRRIPFEEIVPNEWKTYYGIKRKKGMTDSDLKKVSLELCKQFYPDQADEFKRVSVDHNKAEAVLIARYIWHKYEGKGNA